MNKIVNNLEEKEVLNSSLKEKILYFFNNCQCDNIWASSVPMVDKHTGKKITDYRIMGRVVSDITYEKNPYEWDSIEVYYFDKYDLKLIPEFIEFVLQYLNDLPKPVHRSTSNC